MTKAFYLHNKLYNSLLFIGIYLLTAPGGFRRLAITHKSSRPATSLRVRGIQKNICLANTPVKVKKPGPSGLRRGATKVMGNSKLSHEVIALY